MKLSRINGLTGLCLEEKYVGKSKIQMDRLNKFQLGKSSLTCDWF